MGVTVAGFESAASSSSCHHVIMSSCHHVIMSSCHYVITPSSHHPIISSSHHLVISPSSHHLIMGAHLITGELTTWRGKQAPAIRGSSRRHGRRGRPSQPRHHAWHRPTATDEWKGWTRQCVYVKEEDETMCVCHCLQVVPSARVCRGGGRLASRCRL